MATKTLISDNMETTGGNKASGLGGKLKKGYPSKMGAIGARKKKPGKTLLDSAPSPITDGDSF